MIWSFHRSYKYLLFAEAQGSKLNLRVRFKEAQLQEKSYDKIEAWSTPYKAIVKGNGIVPVFSFRYALRAQLWMFRMVGAIERSIGIVFSRQFNKASL